MPDHPRSRSITLKVRALVAAAIAALCSLPIALPAQQSTAALPYTVVTRDARRPLATRVIGGQEMFALDDLARLFNLTVREDAAAGGLTVTAGAQTIVLSTQQPLASVAGRMISLPAAPARDGRTWYVPVDFVSRALASILPSGLELRKPSRLVIAGGVRLPRIAARTDSPGGGDHARDDRRGAADAAHRHAGSDPAPHQVSTPTRWTSRTPASRRPTRCSACARETRQASSRSISGRASRRSRRPISPRRRRDRRASSSTCSAKPTPRRPAGLHRHRPRRPSLRLTPPLLDLPPAGGLRAIVIDAGHGGDDTGAKGAQGTLEKNVTLSVARRLKAALEARLGVRVLLTRDGDQAVAPDQRAALANNNKADLFISLHANASLRPGVAGAEVFYLNLAGYGDKASARRRDPPPRCPSSAAAAARSRSRRGKWPRRATSISPRPSPRRSRLRCASACP